MFLAKQACRVSRVLDLASLPLPGVYHDPLDFPVMYSPLYFPALHPHVFVSPDSVCSWLTEIFSAELFGSALVSSYPVFSVVCDTHYFFVNNLVDDVCTALPHRYIQSSRFHPRLLRFWPTCSSRPCAPAWLFSSDTHYMLSLGECLVTDLRASLARLNIPFTTKTRKDVLCRLLLQHFLDLRTSSLMDRHTPLMPHSGAAGTVPISLLLSRIVCRTFGDCVGSCFLIPDILCVDPSYRLTSLSSFRSATLTTCDALHLSGLSRNLFPKRLLRLLLLKVHPSRRPDVPTSHAELSSTVITLFRVRVLYLLDLRLPQLQRLISCLEPGFDHDIHGTALASLQHILRLEFPGMLFHTFMGSRESFTQEAINIRQRELRALQNAADLALTAGRIFDIKANWPTLPDDEVVYDCLRDYRLASQWTAPPICACCGRGRLDAIVSEFSLDDVPFLIADLNLMVLEIKNPLFADSFTTVPALSEFMLDRRGFVLGQLPSSSVRFCHDCLGSLRLSKMPRFALANHLFRGFLPDEFKDLTWIEEMACSVYRNTAHVSRIYQSSDPSQPRVFHGNTCAHEMNIESTASVLPRTPDNINGLLSVVFIGPGRFKSDCLQSMFHVRKAKIWRFLHWLKFEAHNPLYQNITLDPLSADMYPIDGVLPGIDNRVIHDTHLNVQATFDTETAGIDDHPALQVRQDSDTMDPVIFLEKMGVSDPESVTLQGRSFTASALRNLVREPSNRPDLIIHRSSTAVPEYNNPSLFPGMFPTLYPFGTGGFDNPARQSPLSFQQQANYYFDIPDYDFRYHHSFLFIALNVIQRRTAHLFTSFTIKKPRFRAVASKLVALSAATVQSVAKHLENEGKISDLSVEDRNVLDLLKEVNTVAARIPGSEASKLCARNEIRNYIGYFGLPVLYFTANPNAAHSPIFQVMCGDTSVNLDDCFPLLVSGTKRAMRLARDPVGAADFFEFSIHCILQHLFGWNFKTGSSSKRGGILGFLHAFYASTECTERGGLHAHFLLWLLGALNPSELHARLRADPGFDKKVFTFFEAIIKHHAPNIDIAVDRNFEPRVQRPPRAPVVLSDRSADAVDEWTSEFQSEVKKCAEALQRHTCKAVCHKYGNTDKCRFQFPHDLVPLSYFDSDTNSIYLLCLDSTLNYFNPHILVYCRHNHDLKCILSGKAAKAAMFYITDYITKMDSKTYETLSLLSKAVLQTSDMDNSKDKSPIENARTLLHKCLSQFSRQQQIHAQQAARYIRGYMDTISSHKTIPMLSGMLITHITKMAKHEDLLEPDGNEVELNNDGDSEPTSIKVVVDDSGQLLERNQINDYIYRSFLLQNLSFFEFVHRFRVTRLSKNLNSKARSNNLHRFELRHPHPWCETHEIQEHTDFDRGMNDNLLIPRVIGMSIPRSNTDSYYVFALAHFKPFTSIATLLGSAVSFKECYEQYIFPPESRRILNNWDAIYECEDERDAERLRKRAALTKESMAMTNVLLSSFQDDDETEVTLSPIGTAQKDFRVNEVLLKLSAALWFKTVSASLGTPANLPIADRTQIKLWKIEIRTQELLVQTNRRNASDPTNPSTVHLPDTETSVPLPTSNGETMAPHVPDTGVATSTSLAAETVDDMLDRIIIEDTLNVKQAIAFLIIARAFITMVEDIKKGLKPTMPKYQAPLRLLMTGPGGTGKTHIIKSLQKVMDAYGSKHNIRFLAPTGSAAALIDGMTIHKGLCIRVKVKNTGKGNRKPGESTEDYDVLCNVSSRQAMRDEFKDVTVIFIDEISLLSLQLLSELDYGLRYVKQNQEFFGGIMMIFSGDFHQYPPVGGTPLYTPIRYSSSNSSDELLKRLGRMAWKSVSNVISLTEQERMKRDPEYAECVHRLRNRNCTIDDVVLFNSRAIKSFATPDGIDMSCGGNVDATVIVATNLARQAINVKKASANCAGSDRMIMCAALDTVKGVCVPSPSRLNLLKQDVSGLTNEGSLPGYLALYIGMPVILRNKNISTELGIANGSQGFLRQLNTAICPEGFTYGTSAIIEFPTSKVALPGLPPKFFPIEPIKWTFSAQIDMHPGVNSQGVSKVKVSRSQWGFQPGFACTGHAAQGKTLPNVLSSLREGGFAAYVAASRPNSRYGLAIIDPVTLADLNKPLPIDLIREGRRESVMEHNTLIRYGFSKDTMQQVPDPEGENWMMSYKPKVNFFDGPLHVSEKHPLYPDSQSSVLSKKPKTLSIRAPAAPLDDEMIPTEWDVARYGCQWSAVDWSCSYDSVFMAYFSMYSQQNNVWKHRWASLNMYTHHLSGSFATLYSSPDLRQSQDMNVARDRFRGVLNTLDPIAFPRTGHVLAEMSAMSRLLDQNDSIMCMRLSCTNNMCMDTSSQIIGSVPSVCSDPVWARNVPGGDAYGPMLPGCTQEWFNVLSENMRKDVVHQTGVHAECIRNGHAHTGSLTFEQFPPCISFEVYASVRPGFLPTRFFTVLGDGVSQKYRLCAVLYSGSAHFTARFIDDTSVWMYDGALNNGCPSYDGKPSEGGMQSLTMMGTRHAHIYLYTQCTGNI